MLMAYVSRETTILTPILSCSTWNFYAAR